MMLANAHTGTVICSAAGTVPGLCACFKLRKRILKQSSAARHRDFSSFPQVSEGSFVKKALFNWGYQRKLHFLNKGCTFDKVRRGCTLGGGALLQGLSERHVRPPGASARWRAARCGAAQLPREPSWPLGALASADFSFFFLGMHLDPAGRTLL